MTLTTLGLLVIAGAWLIQLVSTSKKAKLTSYFLLFYMAGALIMAFAAFMAGEKETAGLNFVTAALAGTTWLKVSHHL